MGPSEGDQTVTSLEHTTWTPDRLIPLESESQAVTSLEHGTWIPDRLIPENEGSAGHIPTHRESGSLTSDCPYLPGRRHIQRDGRLVCVDSDGYEHWIANPKNHPARATYRRGPDEAATPEEGAHR